MRKLLVIMVLAGVLAASAVWLLWGGRVQLAQPQSHSVHEQVTEVQQQLLGYTAYTTHLLAGQQALQQHIKLLTASVTRQEGITQVIERSVLGLTSSATVAIWYTAEYAFGFDVQAGRYEVAHTPTGIEIRIAKPQLLTQPAVHNLRYQVLSGGLFTDEQAALLELTAQATRQARKQGHSMASDAAIVALCEKKLIAFLDAFLRQQPQVQYVPQIRVVYTDAVPAA